MHICMHIGGLNSQLLRVCMLFDECCLSGIPLCFGTNKHIMTRKLVTFFSCDGDGWV